MIHPTSNTSAAAGGKGKPSTMQTVITTSKQDKFTTAARTNVPSSTMKEGTSTSTLRRITSMSMGSLEPDRPMMPLPPRADSIESKKTTENVRKDSKVEDDDEMLKKKSSKRSMDAEGVAPEPPMRPSEAEKLGKLREQEQALRVRQDEKRSGGIGELRAAYESESDEYSDEDEDDVNDEFDDTARPGHSATQYGWL